MSSAAVALAMGIAAPALAQDEAVSAGSPPLIAPPPPTSNDAIGPAQLRDFSINGTVTRRAETSPTTAQTAPGETARTATPERSQTATASAATATPTGGTGERTRSGSAQASAASPSSAGSSFDFPPPTPASDRPASFATATFAPQATPPVVDSTGNSGTSPLSYWPWLLTLLAAAGTALWYFRRHRPGSYALAGAGADASAFDFSPPEPAPRAAPIPQPAPRTPVPEAAPKPATAPAGIVSTRLRPWLEIEFKPAAAIVDNEKGAIQFEVTIFNSGSAPAREVLVEAALFNAGPDQDQVIGQFFARPSAQGEGVTVPPLQRMSFRSLVSLPRDQLRIFEVEGRSLFVPLVGFNALYRWSNGQGQTSASFLVGRNTNGEKMGSFRVDQGPKTFRALAAHEHSLRVRK